MSRRHNRRDYSNDNTSNTTRRDSHSYSRRGAISRRDGRNATNYRHQHNNSGRNRNHSGRANTRDIAGYYGPASHDNIGNFTDPTDAITHCNTQRNTGDPSALRITLNQRRAAPTTGRHHDVRPQPGRGSARTHTRKQRRRRAAERDAVVAHLSPEPLAAPPTRRTDAATRRRRHTSAPDVTALIGQALAAIGQQLQQYQAEHNSNDSTTDEDVYVDPKSTRRNHHRRTRKDDDDDDDPPSTMSRTFKRVRIRGH